MNIETRYIDAAEVAKLLRAALKEAFPAVTFAVRTSKYAGGASIDVHYIDGPPIDAAERVAERYAGSYFDGMIDYKGSRYHLLDGLSVHFGANFIFVTRDLSAAALRAGIAAAEAAGAFTDGPLEVEEFTNWRGKPAARLKYRPSCADQIAGADGRHCHAERAIATWYDHGRAAADLEPREGPEQRRVQFAGDDGYGQGTVGRLIDPKAIAGEREAATLN
jgi:hypothetical protein